jgi:hypothetical protein
MARRAATQKPEYRFVVVDATINTWRVKDRLTGDVFLKDYYSPMDARVRAEKLNIDPSLVVEEKIEDQI